MDYTTSDVPLMGCEDSGLGSENKGSGVTISSKKTYNRNE